MIKRTFNTNMNIRQTHWFLLVFIMICLVYGLRTPTFQPDLSTPKYSIERLNQADQIENSFFLKDITLQAGIQIPHTQRSEYLSGLHESLGAGACAFDYDNDGWTDLLLLNGSGTTHFYGKPQWWQANSNSLTLYRNNQKGQFEDITKQAGLTSSSWTMGCNATDLDNDGDQDVVITNLGQNQLWKNNGNGTFSDITEEAGMTGNFWSTSISIADVNQDGLLDIYINNYLDFKTNSLTFEGSSGYEAELSENFNPTLYSGQANQLFINQGNLRFAEQAKALGINNPQGRSLSSQWIDLNNDRYPDLIIANDQDTQNKVFLNQGGKHFEDISTKSKLAFVDKTNHVAVANFNNDRQSELFFTTNNHHYPKLYTINKEDRANIVFKDISETIYLHQTTQLNQNHFGSAAADFNADGFLDIFIANGMTTPNKNAPLISRGQPNTLLINQAGKLFKNQNSLLAPNTDSTQSSRCALSADFNNDGAPDVFTTQNNGLGQLLQNTLIPNYWLGIHLISQTGNRDAIGSIVELHGSMNIQQRRIGQQGFLCSGDKRLLFGLDKSETNKKLVITWPNEEQQTINELKPNRYYTITQNNEPKAIENKAYKEDSQIILQDPSHKLIIIEWLIKHQRYSLAEKELLLLMDKNKNLTNFAALHISQKLPIKKRNQFIPMALLGKYADTRIAAIDFIQKSEDELLYRWLLKHLDDKIPQVVCATIKTISHFFDEEEAMVVNKYTSLTPLIYLAKHENKLKRECAIQALGHSEHYRALKPLIELLKHEEKNTRLVAAQALGKLREKNAIEPLIELFLQQNESSEIRASALASSQQIDEQFDITGPVQQAFNNAHSPENINGLLVTLLHLLQHKEQRVVIEPEKITRLVNAWWQQYKLEKSEELALSYLGIMQYQQDKTLDVKRYYYLLNSQSDKSRLVAYHWLINLSSPVDTSKLLIRGLQDNALRDNLLQVIKLKSIDIKTFKSLADTLPQKLKLISLIRIVQHLDNSEQLTLIKQVLNTSALDKRSYELASIQFAKLIDKKTRAFCLEIFTQNDMFRRLAMQYADSCLLKNSFEKTMPLLFQWALNDTSKNSLRSLAIILIASRNERWARDWITNSLQDDSFPISDKIILLEKLPDPLSSTFHKLLNDLFTKQPNSELAPYMAKRLAKLRNQTIQKLVIKQIRHHLEQNNGDKALQYADALIDTMPDEILNLFLNKSAQQ